MDFNEFKDESRTSSIPLCGHGTMGQFKTLDLRRDLEVDCGAGFTHLHQNTMLNILKDRVRNMVF